MQYTFTNNNMYSNILHICIFHFCHSLVLVIPYKLWIVLWRRQSERTDHIIPQTSSSKILNQVFLRLQLDKKASPIWQM